MMGASERIGTDLEIHFVTKPDVFFFPSLLLFFSFSLFLFFSFSLFLKKKIGTSDYVVSRVG